jgi:hypothetical protein
MGDCLLRVIFLSYRSIPKVLATFFHVKSYVLILTKKMGWVAFWAIFSQTHLATLRESQEMSWSIFVKPCME